MTGELDQTTAVITRGVRGGVIKVSSATAGLSRGISTFLGGEKRQEGGGESGELGEGLPRRLARGGRHDLRYERGRAQASTQSRARPSRQRPTPLRAGRLG